MTQPQPDWLALADRFRIDGDVVIERHISEGAITWFVCSNPEDYADQMLTHEGEWEWEPRTGEMFQTYWNRCQYATKEAAWDAYWRWKATLPQP